MIDVIPAFREASPRLGPTVRSSTIRTGAGVAVVGSPQQVADTLQEFIDIGCTEFCLSGYPHAREAERFGEMLMPFFKDRITSEPLIASSGVAAAV